MAKLESNYCGTSPRSHADVLRRAREKGCEIEVTGGSHLRIRIPGGGLVFTGSTPSDQRAGLNLRAILRRHGLAI